MTRTKFIKLVELIGRGKRVEVVVSGTDLSYLWVVCGKWKCSLRTQLFLFAPRRWLGCFARRNVCVSATEIPYWWHKSSLVVMGFQNNVNLFDFMFLLVDYGKVCVLLRTSSSTAQMLFLPKNINSQNIDCFVVDSSHVWPCLHLTFVAFCVLSVVHKQ